MSFLLPEKIRKAINFGICLGLTSSFLSGVANGNELASTNLLKDSSQNTNIEADPLSNAQEKNENQKSFLYRNTNLQLKSGIGIELYNLNAEINRWFLIKLTKHNVSKVLHLENPNPKNQLELSEKGIKLSGNNKVHECVFWEGKEDNLWVFSFDSQINPYKRLCGGLLYLRLNRSSKTRLSMTEWGTSLLRDHKYGEALINAFKPFLVSLKAEQSETVSATTDSGSVKDAFPFPFRGKIDEKYQEKEIVQHSLGMKLANQKSKLRFGHWYQIEMHPGVYVSLMIPNAIESSILSTYKDRVNKLDPGTFDKLAYFIAYDLDMYGANYVKGTTHPSTNRSEVNIPGVSNLNKYLVPIGSLPPYAMKASIGVFIGGYKSKHSKFRRGPHAGKIYGFVQDGVSLQKLAPGLGTIYSTKSGDMFIEKWPDDEAIAFDLRKNIVGARQNGVLVIDNYQPTVFVNKWREGNWSGDVNGNLKTLRSGACIQERGSKRYLIFGALTAATPSTLARYMQSFHCKNAMQLDMNAYMYLHNMLYKFDSKGALEAQYLHREMEYPKGIKRHRFILDNNERDFFYIFKK